MRKLIPVAVLLGALACGGSPASQPGALYEGIWTVQLGSSISGTMTLQRKLVTDPVEQVEGSWSFGAFGSGALVGNVTQSGSALELLFVNPDHTIAADASTVLSGDTLTGTSRLPPGTDTSFAAHRQ